MSEKLSKDTEGMDKILERLGIYDLFVNFISGIAMASIFQLLITNVWNLGKWYKSFDGFEIWQALILCYFIGVIFQEMSNFLERTLYRWTKSFARKPPRFGFLLTIVPSIDRILLHKSEKHGKKKLKRDLSNWEIDKLLSVLPQEITSSDADNKNEVIYQYCKNNVLTNDKSRYAHDQSHASMARSLSLYSFGVFIVSSICGLTGKAQNCSALVGSIIVSLILFVLFMSRNKRFSEMRYVNVFRSYIYSQNFS